MISRGSTGRLSRAPVILLAPIVTLLLRVPSLLSRDGPFGFDPYIHLYFVKAWSELSSWPVLHDAADVLPSDYDACLVFPCGYNAIKKPIENSVHIHISLFINC